jgi:hypothetical protein
MNNYDDSIYDNNQIIIFGIKINKYFLSTIALIIILFMLFKDDICSLICNAGMTEIKILDSIPLKNIPNVYRL